MTIIKICRIHGELTGQNLKQGIYRGKKYRKCRLCENERSRIYEAKIRNDPEKLKHKHERDKKRWNEKKKEITARRQTAGALEKRRNYCKKLAPKYREKCNEKQREYRETLHDSYIKRIIQNGDKSLGFEKISPAMICFKRSIMMLRKGIKKQNILMMGNKINEIE